MAGAIAVVITPLAVFYVVIGIWIYTVMKNL